MAAAGPLAKKALTAQNAERHERLASAAAGVE
jgi:hypothetical protein